LPAALLEHIEHHGTQDHQAKHDFLCVAFHAGQVHSVLDDGNDERADQCPQHLAFAARQRGAADHHRGDHI